MGAHVPCVDTLRGSARVVFDRLESKASTREEKAYFAVDRIRLHNNARCNDSFVGAANHHTIIPLYRSWPNQRFLHQ